MTKDYTNTREPGEFGDGVTVGLEPEVPAPAELEVVAHIVEGGDLRWVQFSDQLADADKDLASVQPLIAALTAKVKELTKLVSDSEKERYRVCGELLGRAETAEARVAKLEEALAPPSRSTPMKPDWCDEKTWATADYLFRCSSADVIARALLDAHQRGRREGMEEAASVARCVFDDRPRRDSMDWNDGFDDGTKAAEFAIRAKAQEVKP